MNINAELKKAQEIEKVLHKKIDSEVDLEREIDEVAKYTAKALEKRPIAAFTIQKRDFIVIATMKEGPKTGSVIELVAREKPKIITPNEKIYRANLTIDTDYSKEENLTVGIKAILGHVTGHIKPEVIG